MDEAKKVQKQAESFTLRKKVLVDKKLWLGQAMMDMATIGDLDNVGEHLKEQEKCKETILDSHEVKDCQKRVDNYIKKKGGQCSRK